ncbi:hypothetical protein TIFTF001_014165 [Ficus carica]|uniref:Uncharacterized protein n=1 Tax=Ficus carica TaxID=3494 RepID=A0AA87ZZ02_FICCA|nr:hypothetical protein TIFTF001_014165 [Ficus carica]
MCPTTGSNVILGQQGRPTRIHHLTRVTRVPGLDCAPSTSPWGVCAAHLLLQHITSPPAATHSDKVYPCRHRRQQPYCPLLRVRAVWHQSIGPIESAGLRPNHLLGALGSRPGWVARAPKPARGAYK